MKQPQRKLSEGLTRNSLEHLVLPLISIDEYESKIDDRRVIVTGFYVNDIDPADDLSSFIDKSSLEILDTEVSPAPNPDGYFMVFVEIRRNFDFPKALMEMLSEIHNLCGIEHWEMIVPGIEEPIAVTPENLEEHLILDENKMPDIDKIKDEKEKESKIKESNYWKNAIADKIELFESDLTLIKYGKEYNYKLVGNIPEGAMNLTHPGVSILQSLLGPNYNVWGMNENLIVESSDGIRTLKYNG